MRAWGERLKIGWLNVNKGARGLGRGIFVLILGFHASTFDAKKFENATLFVPPGLGMSH